MTALTDSFEMKIRRIEPIPHQKGIKIAVIC